MTIYNISSEIWNESANHARKTKLGNPNNGDRFEYAVSVVMNGEHCENYHDHGFDTLINGKRYENKFTAINPASFGQKEVGQEKSPKNAINKYIEQCLTASAIPFGGFIVGDKTDSFKVMSVEEFRVYAQNRLVYKKSSGNRGYAWKLQKNERTAKMNEKMQKEGLI